LAKHGKFVQCQIGRSPAPVSDVSVGEKTGPGKERFFYAPWAGKFFTYCRKRQKSSESYQENTVGEYLEALKSDPHIADWQIRQAHDAVRLYYFHYRGLKPAHLQAEKSNDPIPALIDQTRRLLRLKHYSYSTERTYLQWIKRFFDYSIQTHAGETGHAWEAEDFRNFISHLALKEKVASSTQNQAFNAVLFL